MCISTFEYVPVMCDLVRLRLREQTTTGGKEKKHTICHMKKSGLALYAATILHGLSCS